MSTRFSGSRYEHCPGRQQRLAFRTVASLALTLALLLAGNSAPTLAQSQSPNYWQYSASGRLRHVVTADVNHDSIDEFLVVDENGNVDLLSSDGSLLWSHRVQEPITAVGTVNIDDSSHPQLEIALGYRNRLTLLAITGQELWSVDVPELSSSGDGFDDEQATLSAAPPQGDAVPVTVIPFDHDNDGREETLVLAAGRLQLYDGDGTELWHYAEGSFAESEGTPLMAVGDLDGNDQDEIALGFFDPTRRFSQLVIIDGEGQLIWDQEQSISGRVTALTLISFGEDENSFVAVGNNIGHINVYNGQRQRVWQRTLNKPITSLAVAHLPEGPGLVAGTNVGSIVAFNRDGRRSWSRYLAPDADRSIIALSAASSAPSDSQPTLSAIIASAASEEAPSDVVLLGITGRTLKTFPAVDTTGLTQLTDINKDGSSELLLARFSQVELQGLGLGVSEIAKGWDYNLFSEPRSVLVADLDQDGNDELLIGTQDGRIHTLDNNKSIRWLHAPGGVITHLALLVDPSGGLPSIVGVRNDVAPGLEDDISSTGWLELRQASGKQIWELALPTRISALAVAELNDQDRPEIIVGTADGYTIVYDDAGNKLWNAKINGGVEHLLALEANAPSDAALLAASANQIFSISKEVPPWRVVVYPQEIGGIYHLSRTRPEQANAVLVFVADGTIRNQVISRGAPSPREALGFEGRPIVNLQAEDISSENPEEDLTEAFFVATDASQLLYVTVSGSSPAVAWQQTGLANSTSLHFSDLDGDALRELVVGNMGGQIRIFKVRSNSEPLPMAALELSSKVLALTAMRRESEQESDLLAVTENGLVQLFRAQENWPPLLTNPRTDVTQNQYSVVVSVQDIENDDVFVRLDVLDPATDAWIAQGEKHLAGDGSLFWLVDNAPAGTEGVSYRFHYDDGFHQGYVLPPMGPAVPPLPPASLRLTPTNMGVLGAAGIAFVILLIRQSQLPAARARRFYRRLKQQSTQTLTLLEDRYRYSDGSPDLLLHLASQARQQGDSRLASLADGLFLLAGQPHAGMPIILRALEDCRELKPAWQATERWHMTHRTGRLLLEAPTITELTLLRPQLIQLLNALEEADYWSPILEGLVPILSTIRDSERVELAEDRIVYLNEAAAQLDKLEAQLPEFSVSIEKTMVVGIIGRWSSLISAEIEELYGRAELAITLKTKRIAPSNQTDVVLAIRNYGRAAAENLIAVLDDDPAYHVCSSPQVIRFLPPGRTRQISFTIEPRVSDRFRIALKVTFDDRNRQDRAVAFGDMVHLLPPVRAFSPIANPYLPGTPLRRDSSIFYGREQLFSFIAENAGELSQRNVLILVGERRTGKTSVLLRLDQHLPSHLIPVYVDCQSLGVLSGMPALLHDLSWYVADALAARGIEVCVPEPAEWQEDPSGLFERRFLPLVKSKLPADTTLLLVFDEFEAFESLVDDGILPPTLFPYLRHLMQHSEGLSFVFVGTRRLEEMSADYWSVLFNIALYRKIGYLSEESATQLICEPVKPNLVYDDLALDKILRVTTGHPYFLQLVCYTLVKRANAHQNGYATISDVNAALDEMLRLGEVHFAYLWQRSTQIERALLTVMAHLIDRDTPFHPADLMKHLRPYGIHLGPGKVTSALNRLVDRDILRQVREGAITLYEMKIGLVGLWVAQYKSLSTLLIGNGEQDVTVAGKE